MKIYHVQIIICHAKSKQLNIWVDWLVGRVVDWCCDFLLFLLFIIFFFITIFICRDFDSGDPSSNNARVHHILSYVVCVVHVIICIEMIDNPANILAPYLYTFQVGVHVVLRYDTIWLVGEMRSTERVTIFASPRTLLGDSDVADTRCDSSDALFPLLFLI